VFFASLHVVIWITKWLIGKKSHLSIENKLLIYKAVTKPMWSYGTELWGCDSNPAKASCRYPNPKLSEP
jgi:hypothetical protein